MNMREALAEMGVAADTLSENQRRQLDEQGYLPLPGILSPEETAAIRRRVETLIAVEGKRAGAEFRQEAGTHRLSNLVDKDPLFEVCFSHPRVLAAMRHVLTGDFKLSSLNGRASLPGEGWQALHADWNRGVDRGDFQVCNSIWLLVDFTAENGATRVVPGSHLSGQLPNEVLTDPLSPQPDEIMLTGKAGTAVIFNSHLWHGGTRNRSASPRYALHSYFTRRGNRQQVDQRAFLSAETLVRLSPAQRFILDV